MPPLKPPCTKSRSFLQHLEESYLAKWRARFEEEEISQLVKEGIKANDEEVGGEVASATVENNGEPATDEGQACPGVYIVYTKVDV